MRTVNARATRVLETLVAKALENEGHIKINNNKPDSGLMPVSVEILQRKDQRFVVSVAHYYEQNGDLMRDLDMTFLAIWKGAEKSEFYPLSFQQDGTGVFQESATLDIDLNVTAFKPRQQADHAVFVGLWMKNVKWQQSL